MVCDSDLERGDSVQVLVVDDSLTIRQQAKSILEREGFSVVPAGNGKEALEQLSKNPGVALVLLDLHMPVMSGFEFLKEHHNKARGHIPVYILTMDATDESIEQAQRHGARGYMVKPFVPQDLLAMVRRATEPVRKSA